MTARVDLGVDLCRPHPPYCNTLGSFVWVGLGRVRLGCDSTGWLGVGFRLGLDWVASIIYMAAHGFGPFGLG